MKRTTIKTLRNFRLGEELRRALAACITDLEQDAANIASGYARYDKAVQLKTVIDEAKTAVDALYSATAPTWAATVGTVDSATQMTIVFDVDMEQNDVDVSQFTISGDTFTGAVWSNSTTLVVTGTGFAAAETLTYAANTSDTTGNLRADYGTKIADGTKVLV